MKMKKKMKIEEEEKEVVVYPYSSKEFFNSWNNWKIYKAKEFKFNYRTLQSEQAALKKLVNESSELSSRLRIAATNDITLGGAKVIHK